MNDPFALLGVDETADDETVRTAYLQQVRACPPDRHPERFQAIRTAYEAIADGRDRMAARLFHAPRPDLSALLSASLQAGPSRPPPLQQLQTLLSETARACRWPVGQGGN